MFKSYVDVQQVLFIGIADLIISWLSLIRLHYIPTWQDLFHFLAA